MINDIISEDFQMEWIFFNVEKHHTTFHLLVCHKIPHFLNYLTMDAAEVLTLPRNANAKMAKDKDATVCSSQRVQYISLSVH